MIPKPEARDQAAVTPRTLRISTMPDLFHPMPSHIHCVCNQPLLAKPEQEWLPVISEECPLLYTMDASSAGLLCNLGWKIKAKSMETLKANPMEPLDDTACFC